MLLDPVVEALGPFLIPAVLFGLGVVGYGVLFVLQRLGVLERL
jgi:hypothetical protein